jgi:hypothetical protein
MATKKPEPVSALTNFDVWKQSLTPEFIAGHKFIVLACGACPAQGKTCNKYDTTCRGNFLNWARGAYINKDNEEAAECKE